MSIGAITGLGNAAARQTMFPASNKPQMHEPYTNDPEINARIEIRIAREIRYGQSRWTEVWLGLIMTAIGWVFLLGDDTFSLDGYQVVARYVNENTAGWIALTVGVARLLALYVNGSVRRSPIIRIVGCAGGFMFFSAMAYGFWLVPGPVRIAPFLFGILAVAELHSSARAARDASVLDSFNRRGTYRDNRRATRAS